MMTYVGTIERESTITIDGYSSAKTIKGAISDMGKYIKKHISESEGTGIIESKEEALLKAEYSCGGYFLEVEEVSGASQFNDETDEMEYKDGYNFYICCRIVK